MDFSVGEDWESEHERLAHLHDSQPESWMKQEFRDSPQVLLFTLNWLFHVVK